MKVLLRLRGHLASLVPDALSRLADWPLEKFHFSARELGRGMAHCPSGEIRQKLMDLGIPALSEEQVTEEAWDLVISVGWNSISSLNAAKHVVFHDSLLPALRGWNPSVTAIENGLRQTGVTAFHATDEVDAGPVIWSRITPIKEHETIAGLLRLQSQAVHSGMFELLSRRLYLDDGRPQNEEETSFSLWRDSKDFEIDWADSASRIDRFVRSRGWPYAGAKTSIDGVPIFVEHGDVPMTTGPKIENRSPGKLLSVENGCPSVVCGDGVYRLRKALYKDGSMVEFRRVRLRLGH